MLKALMACRGIRIALSCLAFACNAGLLCGVSKARADWASECQLSVLHLPSEVFELREPPTWEQQLRRFSFNFVKGIRRWTIRSTRLIRRTVQYWLSWFLVALLLLVLGALISAVDLRLFKVWRERGSRQASRYALTGMAVFLRLLFDRRSPGWSRVAIALALLYGVVTSDLIADNTKLLGWVDDVALIGLTSRLFIRRCKDDVVEEHAAYVRERSARRLPSSSS